MAVDDRMVPALLTSLTQWIVWVAEERNGERTTKVPYRANVPAGARIKASSTDAKTWTTFDQALAFHKENAWTSGVGIAITRANGLTGIDLDHCVGEPWALDLISRLDSYTEVSPSGTGYRIFVRGLIPVDGRRTKSVELYTTGRYLTVTGHRVAGVSSEVEERQHVLDAIYAELFPQKEEKHGEPTAHRATLGHSDRDVWERARASKANGPAFARLWDGDASGHVGADGKPDESAADLALCNYLAYWTGGDTAQTDRLFRASGLYRQKWDTPHFSTGETYGEHTIGKAFEGRTDFYSPDARRPARDATAATGDGSEGNGNDDGSSGNGDGGGHGDHTGNDGDGPVSHTLPHIYVDDRQLGDMSTDALDALVEANSDTPTLFVRGQSLVRTITDTEGRTGIAEHDAVSLRGTMARTAIWIRRSEKALTNVSPPESVAKDLLSLGAWPMIPNLAAVTFAPVLRPDGTVLDQPGYDNVTGLMYAPPRGFLMDRVPTDPTMEHLGDALTLLEKMLSDFPFVDQPSRANMLALLLTLALRPAIPGPVPLTLFDAPQAGTGKGLLADIAARIATGNTAATMAAPEDNEEWIKSITAVLLAGPQLVTIDNVEGALEAPALSQCITCLVWEARLIGTPHTVRLPQRAIWTATGNNVRLSGDLPRRCVWVRLNAGMAHPEQRRGFAIPNLRRWVDQHRSELLWSILVLCRGWYIAGCPTPAATEAVTLGSFEDWCEKLSGVLDFYGITGFLGNAAAMRESADDDAPQWGAFLSAWWSRWGDLPKSVKEVCQEVRDRGSALQETLPEKLHHAIYSERVSLERVLGNALRLRRDMRFDESGLHLEHAGETRTKVKLWKVQE